MMSIDIYLNNLSKLTFTKEKEINYILNSISQDKDLPLHIGDRIFIHQKEIEKIIIKVN